MRIHMGLKELKEKVAVLAFGILLCLCLPFSPARASEDRVKFGLKAKGLEPGIIEVNLSFTLNAGQKAVIKPSWWGEASAGEDGAPTYEPLVQGDPGFRMEALDGDVPGWSLIALSSGRLSMRYRVAFPRRNAPEGAGTAPAGDFAPRSLFNHDLTVIRGYDAFLCPRWPVDMSYIGSGYEVSFDLESGDRLLVPWASTGGSSYHAGSAEELKRNFIAWGDIETVKVSEKEPRIILGFPSRFRSTTESQRSEYQRALQRLFMETARSLGKRPSLTKLTVLACAAPGLGYRKPSCEAMLDSLMLIHGGGRLTGSAAAAAARGILGLWNGYSMVAARKGAAEWFQQGLPWFYGYRLAANAGLQSTADAYTGFAGVYADYLSLNGSVSEPLSVAEKDPGYPPLLRAKGAALISAIAWKLDRDSKGTRDIEWYLGEIAGRFNAFKGRSYSLDDLKEPLETATGKSWDRFFTKFVEKADPILAPDFSATDLFGKSESVSGTGGGTSSRRNWLFLAAAVLFILSIPLIFSAYVRRSVKLDVSMPKILPDDEE